MKCRIAFRSSRRIARLTLTVVATCMAFITGNTCAQGISISGVTEGSAINLSAGAATTNLAVTATPSSPAGATNIAFVLERQGSVFLSRTSPPPYSVTLSNLPAGKYFLSAALMAGGSPPGGDVSFDIVGPSLQPANDNWNQAAVLTGLNVTVAGFNTHATSEANEPTHAGNGSGKSIWWAWNAISNGIFTATTSGSSFDTVLAIYRGTNLDNLIEIAANDDAGLNSFSQATFNATSGVTYYFAVDSASGTGTGNAQLRLVASPPPTISITSPLDGTLFLVQQPSDITNTQATAAINDPAGVARADFWFDGPGVERGGILPALYQLNLTNLSEGHYVLTIGASNSVGLVSLTNAGISVISLAPTVVVEGFAATTKAIQLAVTGFKGPTYALQGSTNLEVWCSVRTWTNFAGAEKVTDTNAAQFNRGFYRASSTQ